MHTRYQNAPRSLTDPNDLKSTQKNPVVNLAKQLLIYEKNLRGEALILTIQ